MSKICTSYLVPFIGFFCTLERVVKKGEKSFNIFVEKNKNSFEIKLLIFKDEQ